MMMGWKSRSPNDLQAQCSILSEEHVVNYLNLISHRKDRLLLDWRKVWIKRVFPTMMTSNIGVGLWVMCVMSNMTTS